MRAVLVPGVPALLPAYASLEDPVAALRAVCLAAVAWAGEGGPVDVVGTAQGVRVGVSLVEAAGGVVSRQALARLPQPPGGLDTPSLVPHDGYSTSDGGLDTPSLVPHDGYSTTEGALPRDGYSTSEVSGLVVVGNGSAKRGEASPGYVDERAVGFDAGLGARLRAGDLAGVDHELARELWADTAALAELAAVLPAGCAVTVDLEDDPFGVQYWVMRWEW